MASEINDALRAISDLGKVLNKAAKEYKETITDVSTLYDNTKRGADKRNAQQQEANYEAVKKTTDGLERLYKKTNDWVAETEKNTKASTATTNGLKAYARSLKMNNPEGMTDELTEALDNIASATDLTTDEIEEFQAIIAKAIVQQKTVAGVELKKIQRTKLVNTAFDNLRENTIGLGRSFDRIKDGAIGVFDDLERAQAHQIGRYGILDQGMDSFSAQMSMLPKSFQDLTIQQKTLMLAAGKGYSDLEGAVGQAVQSFTKVNAENKNLAEQAYALTLNEEEAAKLMSTTLDVLSGVGEKLSFDELNSGSSKLFDNFKKLAQISGKSTVEVATMTKQLLSSEAMRTKINTLRTKTEKRQFIDRTLSEAARYKQLGVSMEQAFKMVEARASFSKSGAITRLKSSQATAQVMNILGMDQKDVDLMSRKGHLLDSQRTDDENQRISELLPAIKTAMDQARGTDKEVQVDAMKQYMGPMLTSIDSMAVNQDQAKKLTDEQVKAAQSKEKTNLGANSKHLASMKEVVTKQLQPWLKQPEVALIGGLGGLLANGATSVFGGVLGGIVGKSISGTMAGTLGKLIPKMGGAMGLLVKAAPPAMAIAVGLAVAEAMTPVVKKWVNEDLGWSDYEIGESIAQGLAFFGNDAAEAAVKQNQATMATNDAVQTLATSAEALMRKETRRRKRADEESLVGSTIKKADADSTTAALSATARTALVGNIGKGRNSLNQIEKQLPKSLQYTRIPELTNMSKIGDTSDVELQQRQTLITEQLTVLRAILEATKGTTQAVSKTNTLAVDSEKVRNEQLEQTRSDIQEGSKWASLSVM